MTRPAPIIAGTLAALLLLFGAYLGSYYAMLAGQSPFRNTDNELVIVPVYRLDDRLTYGTLYPAHQLDRLTRPRYWDGPPIFLDPSD